MNVPKFRLSNGCFESMFVSKLRPASAGRSITTPSVLILAGGGDINPSRYGETNRSSYGISDALDEYELELLDQAVKNGIPVLGVCRGLQMLNVYFGGTLFQDIGTDANKVSHGSFGNHTLTWDTNETMLAGMYPGVNSLHHQAINVLGKGLKPIAWSKDGVVESIRHSELPILGFQFHPELLSSNDSIFTYMIAKGTVL